MKIISQFSHDTLHFVLKLFIFISSVLEATIENWMNENLVPRYSVFLLNLQTLCYKIHCILGQILPLDLKRNTFYFLHQFELSRGNPRSFPMKQFIENEPQSPYIAFWGVVHWFEDLYRHVERCPYGCFHFYVPCFFLSLLFIFFLNVKLLGKPKIAYFKLVSPFKNISWFDISKFQKFYRWMTPSLTRAKNP